MSGSTPRCRARPEQTPPIQRFRVSRRSTVAERVAIAVDMMPGDQSRRTRPLASRIAPAIAHTSGANAAKRRSNAPTWSNRRTTPKIAIAMPATSERKSGRRLPTSASDAGLVAGLGAVSEAVATELVRVLVGDRELPDADVAVDHEPGRPGQCAARVRPVEVEAAGVAVEERHVAGADLRGRRHAHVTRDDEHGLADADVHVHVVVAVRELRAAKVDDEPADAETVAVAPLGGGDRAVLAIADPAVDVDVRGRDHAGGHGE